ncbi:MAG: class I SAM-dependent methyltransferase [Gammaproteobacteria bacterium]
MTDWDAKYALAGCELFGVEPNEYLREIVARSDFRARSALCLADGNGRNSRWLAGHGLRVTALELSSTAVAQAHELDAAGGLDVVRHVADLASWTLSAGARWDAVFILYLQCDAATRLRAIELGAEALMPGGWLVVEAFAKAQAVAAMGPSDEENLYDLAELRMAACGLEVIEALEGVVLLDEGLRHSGEARVVRFAARRTGR